MGEMCAVLIVDQRYQTGGYFTTHFSLLTTYYSLLTTHYSLLTAHHSLLTAHYSPLTAHYSSTHHLPLPPPDAGGWL